MKKFLLPLILFTFFLTSCWCRMVGVSFTVTPLDSETKGLIKGLNISFEKISASGKEVSNKDFTFFSGDEQYYYSDLYIELNKTISLTTKILDWAPIQELLDNYVIKITDPNNIYKDYTTSSLREIIENSEENKNLTLHDRDVHFTLPLEKKQ